MNHRQTLLSLAGSGALGALALAGLGLFSASSTAAPAPPGRDFDVTIENLTAGQIFSPSVLAVHGTGTHMFRTGQPAGSELALLAEDGDGSLLVAALAADVNVDDVQLGTGPILPGTSETIRVSNARTGSSLSFATMLVSTNDTFAGLDSLRMPVAGGLEVYAYAYDAGTEFNSEDCAFIPGPPCTGGGVHDPQPAEGFVHISPGIQGIGGLTPNLHDWRGPVAKITIVRAR
jgi:hypothetical protein